MTIGGHDERDVATGPVERLLGAVKRDCCLRLPPGSYASNAAYESEDQEL